MSFRRFPLAEEGHDREPSRYIGAMSAYFRTNPYHGWFNAFEPLLDGTGASYFEGSASTALHTDICPPVATNPTWSALDESDRSALEADGGPLRHMLLEELRPQVVAVSVAKSHLQRIEFAGMTNWRTIHVFGLTAGGDPRSRPCEVRSRSYQIRGMRSLFVFGAAAQKPFGLLSDFQKREAGPVILDEYQDGGRQRLLDQVPDPAGGAIQTLRLLSGAQGWPPGVV